jgi:formylglycine-generating enzyme required for sulfatase activity
VAYSPPTAGSSARAPGLRTRLLIGVVSIVLIVMFGFLFTASSVRIETDPAGADVELAGGFALPVGDAWLLRPGQWRVTARASGYAPLQQTIEVTDATNQRHTLALKPLPGQVLFTSDPPGADVYVNDQVLGKTPLGPQAQPAGPITVTYELARYEPLVIEADVTGREQAQTLSGALLPNWGDVTIDSTPAGAEIYVDDETTGLVTPAVVPIIAGEHELRVSAPGYQPYRQRLLIEARTPIALPPITLTRADGLLRIRTTPAGAGITLNGQYQGQSPLEVAVESGTDYRVQAFSAGYTAASTRIRLASGDERTVNLALGRTTGKLVVIAEPPEAELLIGGRAMGRANQTLSLPTGRQSIEVRAPGYAAYTATINPREGVTQEVRVRLLTVDAARLASLQPRITSPDGSALVLLKPDAFTMGASRRQPGRRANETQREVTMQRFFYLGTREVTNAAFRQFVSDHDSGAFQDTPLNEADQPVVNISWQDAALYCNWLSAKSKLPPFYVVQDGKVTGINAGATGYRLPTEAEWEWALRQTATAETDELRFPWGQNLPPPDRHGNYADRSASNIVGRIIFGYNDNYITSAPVGTYRPNPLGLHDLSGNVAEWVNDFHEIPAPTPVTDPLGPAEGKFHVIRGSSWMHGTITELRVAFRDYGNDGRQDVGFRIARFAEAR